MLATIKNDAKNYSQFEYQFEYACFSKRGLSRRGDTQSSVELDRSILVSENLAYFGGSQARLEI